MQGGFTGKKDSENAETLFYNYTGWVWFNKMFSQLHRILESMRPLNLLIVLLTLSAPLSSFTLVRPFNGCEPLVVPDGYKDLSWFLWPEKTGGKDTLTALLLYYINAGQRYHDSIPVILAAALSHHLLYRLGRDSSFSDFTRAVGTLESKGYHSPSVSLLKAAQTIISGNLIKGLYTIDSVKAAQPGPDAAFMRDYLHILAYCFIPTATLHPVPYEDEETPLFAYHHDSRVFGTMPLEKKEITPEHMQWSLHEAYHPALPSGVSLSARFNLITSPTLQIPLLHPVQKLSLSMMIDSVLARKVIDWTVADPFIKTAPMELSIAVYPGNHPASLDEFMYAVVANNFDQVRLVKTLSRFDALSVRCRTHRVTSREGGIYTAFIVFDAGIFSSRKSIRMVPAGTVPGKPVLPVRYLISMRADRRVEQKAEQILGSVVRLFEGRL
jgi:hypothetical protein